MGFVRALAMMAFVLLSACPAFAEADGPTIARQTKEDFLAGRFDLLEAAAERYRTQKSVSPSGNRLLAAFYSGLVAAGSDDGPDKFKAHDRQFARLRAWLKAYPRSQAGHIFEAELEMKRGWLIRGDGFAHTVSPQQWQGFRTQIDRAYAKLSDIRGFASDDPQWYATMLSIALVANVDDAAFDALAAEALDRDPGFGPTREVILRRRLPEWGGSWEAYDQSIDDFVTRTSASMGQSLYALAYWGLADVRFGPSIFTKSRAKWPLMKKGFEDLVARYPSEANLNAFGAFACLVGDFDTLRPLLDRLTGRMNRKHWDKMVQMSSCVYAANRERIEAEAAAYYTKPRPMAEERSARNAITQAAAADFIAGRFDRLDLTHAEYLAGKSTTGSGAWKLEFFYDGLTPLEMLYAEGARADQPTFEKVEAQTDAWLAAAPSSKAAAISKARIFWANARNLRSAPFETKAADENTAKAFALLARARRVLEASRPVVSDDPEWWATLLRVAHADGSSAETQDALAAEALAQEPSYPPILSAILSRALIPAPTARFADMAKLVIAAAPVGGGPEAYARSVLWFSDVNHLPDLIARANVDWPTAKAGLDVVAARYPSDWNLNAYANLACMAKDKLTAQLLFTRLEDRIVDERWSDWRAPAACRKWAEKGVD